MNFKTFKSGAYTDEEVTVFFNTHIIMKDKFLENGDIMVFYKDVDKIGGSVMDRIEEIDRSVAKAQLEIFDAQMGLTEVDGTMADLDEKISKANPDEKEDWTNLQQARNGQIHQRILHNATIEGRNMQINDLKLVHQELLKELAA